MQTVKSVLTWTLQWRELHIKNVTSHIIKIIILIIIKQT